MIEYKTLIPEITLKFKTGNEQKAKISTSQDCFKVMLSFYDMDLLELTESFIVLFLKLTYLIKSNWIVNSRAVILIDVFFEYTFTAFNMTNIRMIM